MGVAVRPCSSGGSRAVACDLLQDFHNPFSVRFIVTKKDGRYFYVSTSSAPCVDAEQKLDALKQRNEADGPVFKMRIVPV